MGIQLFLKKYRYIKIRYRYKKTIAKKKNRSNVNLNCISHQSSNTPPKKSILQKKGVSWKVIWKQDFLQTNVKQFSFY